MIKKYLIGLFLLISIQVDAQTSQVQIARNSVGKLQASIANKADVKKQLSVMAEGLKALELAQVDKKTKNWPETWAIKAYLSSYISIIDDNETNADKYAVLANEAFEKAKSLDKYQSNATLIAAANHNIILKKQKDGNRAYQQNDFSAAFNLLKQVSEYFATDTTLAVNTAICAQNIQNYNDALTYYKKAKDNGIKNPFVFQYLASAYSSKFESELAIKTLEDGLALNPYHPYLTSDYINVLLDNEKYEKALKIIEGSIATEKRSKLLLFLYGYLQQTELNNKSTAELAFKKALDQDQNYFDALYQLGIVYINYANDALKEKNKQKVISFINRAEMTLLRAHEINPNDRNTVQILIQIYTKKNKVEKVQELQRKLNEF